jgi:hypothetical protein
MVSFADGASDGVDVLKEPLNHPLTMMEFGPVIALPDAVALKMGAPLIAAARAWAQEWSTQIGLDLVETEPWFDDDD